MCRLSVKCIPLKSFTCSREEGERERKKNHHRHHQSPSSKLMIIALNVVSSLSLLRKRSKWNDSLNTSTNIVKPWSFFLWETLFMWHTEIEPIFVGKLIYALDTSLNKSAHKITWQFSIAVKSIVGAICCTLSKWRSCTTTLRHLSIWKWRNRHKQRWTRSAISWRSMTINHRKMKFDNLLM